MNPSMIRRGAFASAVVFAIAACGASAPPVADKAGGAGTPEVLRLGTPDYSSAVSARPIELYKAEVERTSGGLLTIDPVYSAAGGDVDRWDQRVAEAVISGDLDLAVVPARAFDELGVTSLQALQAPFLLTDDDVVDRVVMGDQVDDLMSGLPAIGIDGLALWPDNLRHPVSFGDPIVSLDDFRALAIRTPLSRASNALLQALGSTPVDLKDSSFEAGLADGSIGAVESTIAGAQGTRKPSVVTANITFFPKITALIANEAVFGRMSDEQRRWLRDAAGATTASLVKSRTREGAAATELCAKGGSLALASRAEIEAIEAAAMPLYADLEKDPLTKQLIAEFRELRAGVAKTAVSIPTCEPSGSPRPSATAADVATGDQSVLDGIYRYEVTEEYLLSKGVERGTAHSESGVHTLTMANGVFTDAWTNAVNTDSCAGTYTLEGRRVTLRWTGNCFGDTSASYERIGDVLRWSDIQALPPNDTAADQANNEAFWGVPYTRIGDAP